MLRKPTERKVPKRYNKQENNEERVLNSKSANKLVLGKNQQKSNIPPANNKRVPSLQKKVNKIQNTVNNIPNAKLQAMLIQQIKGIKDQLKQIKQQIGINQSGNQVRTHNKVVNYAKQQQVQYQQPEQNIFNMAQQHSQQENIYQPQHLPIVHNPSVHSHYQQQEPRMQPVQKAQQRRIPAQNFIIHPKQLIEVGRIQPYMRQFKIDAPRKCMPFYNGYHKKSSKPVIIKYCSQQKSMDPIFNLYQKLWKNIVKAKEICINKVYDLNEPLASNILVIQANQYSLDEILQYSKNTISNILVSLLKALQFFHQCGYLYRNMHPWHVMQSFEGNIVLIDLKNMKRFVDMKGKHMAVKGDQNQPYDQFMSNARIRKVNQGRKDDLQTLGYLALYMFEGRLPWNIDNMIQLRSTLTLKKLYSKYPSLLQFMVVVSQMQAQDMPDYNSLASMLGNTKY